jgi:hypothetical protein
METDRSRVCILLFSVLFRPLKKDSGTYIDGGLLNKPLQCIDNAAKQDDESDSILVSPFLVELDRRRRRRKTDFSTIFTYIRIVNRMEKPLPKPIKNEIIVKAKLGRRLIYTVA